MTNPRDVTAPESLGERLKEVPQICQRHETPEYGAPDSRCDAACRGLWKHDSDYPALAAEALAWFKERREEIALALCNFRRASRHQAPLKKLDEAWGPDVFRAEADAILALLSTRTVAGKEVTP